MSTYELGGSEFLRGATDDTPIGNNGDRLLVSTVIDSIVGGISNTLSKKYRIRDMNASNGGVARESTIGATWTDVFSYSGSGNFYGFEVNLESYRLWYVRLVIDGEEIFDGSDGIYIGDFFDGDVYNFSTDRRNTKYSSFSIPDENFVWFPIYPIKYETSAVVKVRKSGGARKFYAGFVEISEET